MLKPKAQAVAQPPQLLHSCSTYTHLAPNFLWLGGLYYHLLLKRVIRSTQIPKMEMVMTLTYVDHFEDLVWSTCVRITPNHPGGQETTDQTGSISRDWRHRLCGHSATRVKRARETAHMQHPDGFCAVLQGQIQLPTATAPT